MGYTIFGTQQKIKMWVPCPKIREISIKSMNYKIFSFFTLLSFDVSLFFVFLFLFCLFEIVLINEKLKYLITRNFTHHYVVQCQF